MRRSTNGRNSASDLGCRFMCDPSRARSSIHVISPSAWSGWVAVIARTRAAESTTERA